MAKAEQINRDADRNLAQGLRTVKAQQEQLVVQETELKSLKDAVESLLGMIPEAEGGGEVSLIDVGVDCKGAAIDNPSAPPRHGHERDPSQATGKN